ncbi:MAG: T9SS type A sorting domain-containing protein [Melioribacteraceae bacterium]|nr:T9SS type A sorting domain-containing protein [Melioribacteraceae bacterium]
MRRKIIFILLLSFTINYAQYNIQSNSVVNEFNNENKFPVDARPLIEKFDKVNNITEKDYQPISQSLRKTTLWNFVVGSQKNWYASDFTNNQFYVVNSTCRAVGTTCYIFVEDSLWAKGRVNQDAVNSVMNAFDKSTPANPNKGIYQTNVETFGNPPDVDNDPKIIILILNIRDGYSGGGYVAGYFHGYHQGSSTYSNKAEIYYLDGNPLNLTTTGGLNVGMSTTAHEFQHMIHYNYHPGGQETFFNEAWSLIAEVVNGYNLYNQSGYNSTTNRYLFNWSSDNNDVLRDYSRAARFSLYLYEQFGAEILKRFVQSKLTSVNALDFDVLPALNTDRRFADILVDWWIANYLNDKSINPRWGYNYPNLARVNASTISTPNYNGSDFIYKLGAQYVTFNNGKNLSIIFNSNATNSIKVKAIKIGTNQKEVVDVQVGKDVSFNDFGTTFNNITFMIYHADRNEFNVGPFNVTYQAVGNSVAAVKEIKYDETEPTGYLQLTAGDSVAVVFDAAPGMKLDSIKVALRGITQLQGRVLETYGIGSQLGGKLLASITAIPTLTSPPPVVNNGAEYPYQIPYPNWVKVDLRQFKLTADKSFVVQFPVGAAYPATNRVMCTYYPSDASYHSFAYQSTNNPPRWVYYSVSGRDGYIFLFLIRAYVSSPGTNIEGPIEILPSAFSLEQNYPNPFNPETIISYSLPKQSRVQIKIFDITGKEIRTLIDEERAAGKYNILWDSRNNLGQKVSSGIYIYKIIADNFVQTKKMVLAK